ncbi:hypothetical protein ACI3ET_12310 [Ornithinimicrobium sp. LYQ121]|uniref:hypothetical protein n=1 Tax=Ornithinimicrobium sp. LYQ121 TaxID=3378801 RepID=UPI00385324EA
MARARHEASWTDEDAVVKGRVGRNRAWVLLALFAALAVLSTVTFNRFMNFQDVTYQLRSCTAPLTQESTWDEVQAAACDPVPAAGAELTLWAASHERPADATTGDSWTFEDVPVNTAQTSMEIRLPQAARSVVLAEPDNEVVRRELRPDASDRRWTANVGGRGPTTYWVLVTPAG